MKKVSIQLSGILLLSFVVVLMNCSKKKVENFTEPKKIFFVDQKDSIEVLQTEEPLAEKIGTISDIDSVEIIASVAIEKKDMVYKTYQFKCPSSIKHKCKTEFGYIREFDLASSDYFNSTSSYSETLKKRLIVSESEYLESNDLKKLILDPKSIHNIVVLYHYNIFQFLMNSLVTQPDDRLLKTEEVYQIIQLLKNSTRDDQYITSLKKKYPFLKEVNEEGVINSVVTNNDFEEKLTETRNELLNSYIAGFPLRASTFKGLVGQFNKLKNYPYLSEKVFEYLSKEGVYSVSGFEAQYLVNADSGISAINKLKKIDPNLDQSKVVALFGVLNDAGTNFQLKLQILDVNGNVTKEDTYSLVSISAEESGNSLGFKVKTDKQDFIISPLETTPNLLIAGEGFKEYLKTIPNDYKDIIKNNNYEKAKMLIALKFGEGGFDEKLGKMVYILSASKRYWIMLDLFRFNSSVKRTTDYSGTLETSFSVNDNRCFSITKWRQPKGELFITGTDRSCYDEYEGELTPIEDICFFEGSSKFFQFEFSPSELRSDKPSVDFKYEDSGVCQVIQEIMN
ncbi:hypothetical protein [Leptospira paudalimensis]|uniref:Lipoprotein n=1 Tax=Leptospira paudalimensis TaxID=2950024 RepID=A0ABT3MAI2_9LEPT|nr:hypothetical protein [Leptospira paudalimensis]MCW7505395.1 hypothetical protein [Leptospira paudalimensis]